MNCKISYLVLITIHNTIMVGIDDDLASVRFMIGNVRTVLC